MRTLIPFLMMAAASLPLSAEKAPGDDQAEVPVSPAQALANRGLEWAEAFPGLADLCAIDKPLRRAGQRPKRPSDAPRRERRERPQVPPTKVFDNLYFVGTGGVSSWVIETSEGLIVIDALNNNAQAEKYIAGGLANLGLDPKDIKYLIITHGHGDHYGGQQFLVERYGPRVVMSDADWTALENPVQEFSNPRWGKRPARDISIQDSDTITLGDTTVELYVTPGHTWGTLSLVFPVKDGDAVHHAALWGGTGLNFGPDIDRIKAYARSAERFGAIARDNGVDVFLSNHPRRDGSIAKMAALEARDARSTHPYVMDSDATGAFDLLRDCTTAQALKLEANENTASRQP